MSNLLPAAVQKNAWKFQRSRFVLVSALVLLGGAVLAFSALLPGYVLVRGGATPMSNSLLTGTAAESGSERADVIRAQILSEQFSFVASSKSSSIEAVAAAIRARPSGASVEEIQYEHGEEGTIIIRGNASDRTSVSAYRDALALDSRFSSISVPASALAGAEDGRFTITLTGSF